MNIEESKTDHLNIAPTGGCFWGHKWSQWDQYEQDIRGGGIDLRQKKHCLRCNKEQNVRVA